MAELNIDMNKLATDKMNELLTNGKFNEIIEKSLVKMMESACDSVFSTYGDIAKSVQATIKENVKIDLNQIDFATYNHNLSVIVKSTIESILNKNGIEKVKELISDQIGGDIPKEIKLSDLMEKLKEDIFNSSDDKDGGEISLYVEDGRDGYHWLHFDPSSNKSKHSCKYAVLTNKENKFANIKIGGVDRSKSLMLGSAYGFDMLMFQLYAAGSTIIIDEDDVNLSYGHDDN